MAQIYYGKSGASGTQLWVTTGTGGGHLVRAINASTTAAERACWRREPSEADVAKQQ